MPIPRRYGVQDTINFPMIKRGVVDFATSSDWTPVQSDTRVQLDTASASYATNVVSATGSRWVLTLTAAELSARKIGVFIIDAATKAVEDQDIEIETYGSPLAQQGFDYTVATITLSQAALNALAVQVVNTVWATASRTLTSAESISGIRKNVALAKFEFLMTDSTNHAPVTGKTVTVTRSIDNGAFAAGTLSAVTEIAFGIYSVDFGAGDLNGTVITLRATAAASDDLLVTIVPDP
jgi:hypothetical protein